MPLTDGLRMHLSLSCPLSESCVAGGSTGTGGSTRIWEMDHGIKCVLIAVSLPLFADIITTLPRLSLSPYLCLFGDIA